MRTARISHGARPGGRARTRRALESTVAVCIAATALVLALPAIGARAMTTTTAPIADSWVDAKHQTATHGSDTRLSVRGGTSVETAYLTFTVSPPAGTITAATLTVYVASTGGGALSAHSVGTTSWTESTLSYRNAPAYGPVIASSPPTVRGQWATVDLTSAIAGAGTYSFSLTTTSGTEISVWSREAGATRAPQLSISTSADSHAPTTPANVTATGASDTEVDVAWSASTDDVGVTGYTVYRDGSAIATTPATQTAFADTGLAPSESHSYAVDAFDAQGNHSSVSAGVTGTALADTTPPSSPSPLTLTAVGSREIDLSWPAATDDVGVTGYVVTRDGVTLAALPATARSLADTTVQPSSTHQYAVTAVDAAGNPSSPGTGSATALDPVIAAAGDIACSPADSRYNGGVGTAFSCRQLATSTLLTGGSLDGVLALGDEQYENGELANFQQAYDPTWGRVRSITFPAPGNHEYQTAGASGYFSYFGAAAGDPARGWYSFDLGAWHVVALNSNCSQIGGCGTGSAEEQWLKADLAAHPGACTLAFWHHPRFSSGWAGNAANVGAFWQDLYAAHVDIVLNGHDHDYERFAIQNPSEQPDANGIREFVVGTGGEEHHGWTSIQPTSEVRNDDTFGVLGLTLRPTSYEWSFVPEAGKTFTDSGSEACR